MKLYKYNFIGQDNANVIQSWSGSDSTENLASNLAKMPVDWYYRNNEVSYHFNSFGHRSKELDCLDMDNYALFVGCSHTEGVGLELSKTYPYLVSKKLACDYYNLGLGGTGIDTLLHNLIIWSSVVAKLPKVLVIQWPENYRYITTNNSSEFTPKGAWNKEPEVERFILAGTDTNFFRTRKILASKIIETLFKCPTIQINLNSKFMYVENRGVIKHPKIDFARDNMHFGIECNLNFADTVYQEILSGSETS